MAEGGKSAFDPMFFPHRGSYLFHPPPPILNSSGWRKMLGAIFCAFCDKRPHNSSLVHPSLPRFTLFETKCSGSSWSAVLLKSMKSCPKTVVTVRNLGKTELLNETLAADTGRASGIPPPDDRQKHCSHPKMYFQQFFKGGKWCFGHATRLTQPCLREQLSQKNVKLLSSGALSLGSEFRL